MMSMDFDLSGIFVSCCSSEKKKLNEVHEKPKEPHIQEPIIVNVQPVEPEK